MDSTSTMLSADPSATSMYTTIYLDERVSLTPLERNTVDSPEAIRHLLEQKLREMHESKCNLSGYVRAGSLKLLAKSMGLYEHGRFTGNVLYDCRSSCEVYYPTVNSIIQVKIHKLNKMGAMALLATDDHAMRITIARDMHVGDLTFDALELGMQVWVKLLTSKFKTNEPYITAVAKLHTEKETLTVR
jgi:DNA-directed RNA polymerase subunit E'/Rpb7